MSSLADLLHKKQRGFWLNPICFLLLICILLTIPLLPAFNPPDQSDFSSWKYADLLWIDPGNADNPENSLIAVYLRQQAQQTQIRLDLLELNRYDANDITIALDVLPGGRTQLPINATASIDWDVLISASAGETPQVVYADGQSKSFLPRVQVDPVMEMVVISWNRDSLKGASNRLNFQVFVSPAGSNEVASQSPKLHPGMPSPPAAPMLLAFWNTLPAETPAQALRRWDGAHTGPVGQRHGLNTLLTRASEYRIPVVALDLRQPESLSALEYMNHLNQVRTAVISQQVVIPNFSWGDPQSFAMSTDISHRQSEKSSIPDSLFHFGPVSLEQITPGRQYFAEISDRQHIQEWQGAYFIPLPQRLNQPNSEPAQDEISKSGLSLRLKQALLSAALSTDTSDLVVVGGNLSQSLWGEDSIAPLAFRFISTHPWIRPMDSAQLSSFPKQKTAISPFSGCKDILCTLQFPDNTLFTSTGTPIPSSLTGVQLTDIYRQALSALPKNIYTQYAVSAFLSLTSATSSSNLIELKQNYLHQVGYLIYAAQWSHNPTHILSADLDVDWDGMPEIILASDQFIAILEPDDGRMVLAGSKYDLWIAPSSLFAVGLGSPENWKLGFGSASDLQVIPGAFSDPTYPSFPYTISIEPNQVTLTHPDFPLQKTVQLTSTGFSISIKNLPENQAVLPMVLATHHFMPSDWAAAAQPSCQAHTCSLPTSSGFLTVKSNAAITLSSSLDSAPFMQSPEIPDRNYPPGHFLPFPLATLDFTGSRILQIDLISE